MPRYFFHVSDGMVSPDLDGTELLNIEAARVEAVKFAGALLRDRPEAFWRADEWVMRVTDEADLTLFQLIVFANDGAVIR